MAFVLYDQQTLVAAGECIPSQKQPSYADLGMVVARSYRGRGLGSFLLTQLKKHCYEAGWKPICSCEASNRASKKAIEGRRDTFPDQSIIISDPIWSATVVHSSALTSALNDIHAGLATAMTAALFSPTSC